MSWPSKMTFLFSSVTSCVWRHTDCQIFQYQTEWVDTDNIRLSELILTISDWVSWYWQYQNEWVDTDNIRLSELILTISHGEIKDKMSKVLILIHITYWYSGIWCKVHLRHLYHTNSQHWHLLLQKNTTSYFHTCPRPHVCQYDYTLCICNEHQ